MAVTEVLRIVRDVFCVACLCHSIRWFVAWDMSYFWEWTSIERLLLLVTSLGLTLIQFLGRRLND
jgi:hypothetical protein